MYFYTEIINRVNSLKKLIDIELTKMKTMNNDELIQQKNKVQSTIRESFINDIAWARTLEPLSIQ